MPTEEEFMPARLNILALKLSDVHQEMLCLDEFGADPSARLLFVAALDYLSLAINHLKLAAIQKGGRHV